MARFSRRRDRARYIIVVIAILSSDWCDIRNVTYSERDRDAIVNSLTYLLLMVCFSQVSAAYQTTLSVSRGYSHLNILLFQ